MQELHINPEGKQCLRRYQPEPTARNNFCLKYCNHSKRCFPKQRAWLEDEFLHWQIKNTHPISDKYPHPDFKIPYAQHLIMTESLTGEPFQ